MTMVRSSSVSATPPVIEIYFLIGNDSTPRKLSPLFISASPIGGELGTSFHLFWPYGHLLSTHSEASTPLDVPGLHTLLPESHDAGSSPFTPLLLQPRLATSRSAFLTFTLSNTRLIGLHPTALRLATYCSSLNTGASLCLLHTTWQHWVSTSLRAMPTSLPP